MRHLGRDMLDLEMKSVEIRRFGLMLAAFFLMQKS
jgi:hypothetical protein